MIREHSPEAREVLRKASLSLESELDEAEAARLNEAVGWYAEDPDVTGHQLRNYIMPQSSYEAPGGAEGETIMAKATTSKRRGRPARPELSKAQVTKLAKLRRDGGTWADVSEAAGQVRSSTDWAVLFNEHGFEKTGVKTGSNQTSKARAWGSASNGKPSAKKGPAKPKGKRVRKATAKK